MKTIARLWKYYKPAMGNKLWMFWYTLFAYMAGAALARLVIPVIYEKIINTIFTATTPLAVQDVLVGLILVLLAVGVGLNIIFRSADFVNSKFQSITMKRLYDSIYHYLSQHSFDFFSNSFSGSLVAKTKRFVNGFEDMCDRLFFDFSFSFVVIVGSLVVLLFKAPSIALILGVGMVLFVTAIVVVNAKGQPLREREAEADSVTTGSFADIISNIVSIKSFAQEPFEASRLDEVTTKQHVARLAMWNFDNMRVAVMGAIFLLMEVGAMYMAVRLWLAGSIDVGTVVLVQIYFGHIFYSAWNLARALQRFNKALADSEEMLAILERPIDIQDASDADEFVFTAGSINFSHVDFAYPQGAEVFKDFDVSIPAGQRVGIVGYSGAGKTTITKLLLRFYDVDAGKIEIDDMVIQDVPQASVRKAIAYVPQEPLLFHRSIRDNIAYGNPEASEEQIIDAAKRARAHEFIETLPKGYDTYVGERGVKLSGGERQRIAIARAMLKSAPVLVLDEATSSLDSYSELKIQEALKELMQGRTTIAIAHRLSTIQKMDRIIVLDGGVVIEDGTHTELLEKKGVYHELWSHQSAGFIAE